jgi:hypothetical protein
MTHPGANFAKLFLIIMQMRAKDLVKFADVKKQTLSRH